MLLTVATPIPDRQLTAVDIVRNLLQPPESQSHHKCQPYSNPVHCPLEKRPRNLREDEERQWLSVLVPLSCSLQALSRPVSIVTLFAMSREGSLHPAYQEAEGGVPGAALMHLHNLSSRFASFPPLHRPDLFTDDRYTAPWCARASPEK